MFCISRDSYVKHREAIKNLRSRVESILGEYFDEFYDYFRFIAEYDADYKILAARRCLVLYQIFAQFFWLDGLRYLYFQSAMIWHRLKMAVCCRDGCRLVAGFVAGDFPVWIREKPVNKGYFNIYPYLRQRKQRDFSRKFTK